MCGKGSGCFSTVDNDIRWVGSEVPWSRRERMVGSFVQDITLRSKDCWTNRILNHDDCRWVGGRSGNQAAYGSGAEITDTVAGGLPEVPTEEEEERAIERGADWWSLSRLKLRDGSGPLLCWIREARTGQVSTSEYLTFYLAGALWGCPWERAGQNRPEDHLRVTLASLCAFSFS